MTDEAIKPLRSFLFIPGDEKKLGKVDGCGAGAVILDLEDAVAPANKPLARQMVADFLKARPREGRTIQLWVRVNPFDTGLTADDVAAIVPGSRRHHATQDQRAGMRARTVRHA